MTIPENLRICFNNLDFLAGVKDNQKICFKNRYYVERDGWSGIIGAILRTIENERMDVSGISEIKSICASAIENYNSNFYPEYREELLDKIVAARKGLNRLKITYESLGKTVVASEIYNSSILDLDKLIPVERKIKEGFQVSETQKKKKDDELHKNKWKIERDQQSDTELEFNA